MEALYELIFRSIGPILLVAAVTLYNQQEDSLENLQMHVKENMQENDGVYSQHDGQYDETMYDRNYLIGVIAGGFTQTVEINMQASAVRSRVAFTPISDGTTLVEYYEGTGATEYMLDSYVYRSGSGGEGFDFSRIVNGVYELHDDNGKYVYLWVSN